jgi:hypothetical protein
MSSLQLSRAQEKLRILQEQLETKHRNIGELEADIGALKAQLPSEATKPSSREHTLTTSIQRYRQRFGDGKQENRISRKPRQVKVYYNGKSITVDAHVGARALPESTTVETPSSQMVSAACDKSARLVKEYREIIIVPGGQKKQASSMAHPFIHCHLLCSHCF